MKFSCPHCGQHILVDEDVAAGAEVGCPSCGKPLLVPDHTEEASPPPHEAPVATPPRVQKCPDCGSIVSLRAAACPHCGAPLAAASPSLASSSTSPVTRNVADAERSSVATVCFITALLTGVGIVGGSIIHFNGGLLVLGVIIILVSVCIYNNAIEMHCHRCGYNGKPRHAGGPSGCVLFLLLCIGIIPGLIYLLVVKDRLICPNCGQEVIR